MFNQNRIVRCTDKQLRFARLDRPWMGKRLRLHQRLVAAGGGYADCNMRRPFKEFEELNVQVGRLIKHDMTLSPLLQRFLTAHHVDKTLHFLYSAVGL